MAVDEIRKFRKLRKKHSDVPIECFLGGGPNGADWSDSILMILERLDDLRQFVLDEFFDDEPPPGAKRELIPRYVETALNHIDYEIVNSIRELALLRNDVRESETNAQIQILEKKNDPDTRRYLHGHHRRPGEQHRPFIERPRKTKKKPKVKVEED